MLKRLNSNKGFTLIELLIVVAIIGILAAIAIPQFSAYRMRGYNATALSDMRNAKTAEESLYADATCYGSGDGGNQTATVSLTAAVAASGLTYNGPISAAVGGAVPVAGGRISGNNASGAMGAMPLGVSNGVNLLTNTSVDTASVPVAGKVDSYVIGSRHINGDTAYATDSDNTSVSYRVVNSTWAGNPANVATVAATVPAATFGADNLGPNNTINGGGSPSANWTLM